MKNILKNPINYISAKDKAIELINTFGKQMALLVVDEIIKSNYKEREWWLIVKLKINEL